MFGIFGCRVRLGSSKLTSSRRRQRTRTDRILKLVAQMRLVLTPEVTVSPCDPGTVLSLRREQLALLLLEQIITLIDEPLVEISDQRLNEDAVFIVLAQSHDETQIFLHSVRHDLHKRQLLDLLRVFVDSCGITLHSGLKHLALVEATANARLLV